MEGDYAYKKYIIDESCRLDCAFQPREEKELREVSSYQETLAVQPYSVIFIKMDKAHFPVPIIKEEVPEAVVEDVEQVPEQVSEEAVQEQVPEEIIQQPVPEEEVLQEQVPPEEEMQQQQVETEEG